MRGNKLIFLAVFPFLLALVTERAVIAQVKPSVKPLVLRFAHMSPPRVPRPSTWRRPAAKWKRGLKDG